MKRSTKMLAFLMAALMVLSAAPLTPFSAFLPKANATDETDLNIDFNYAADHGIGSAADALAQKGAGGTTNTGVNTDYYKSNYNKFRWKHVLYDFDPAIYGLPSMPGADYANGLTIKDNDEGSLRYLLTSEADEDTYIALTCDLTRSYTGNTVWKTIRITKDKVLDLNGYTINMMYGRNRKGKAWNEDHYKQSGDPDYHNSVFITIDEGATLTIIDSSMWRQNGITNEGTGGIIFHGYMVSPHYSEMNYYTTRDLFHVNNGNLVIYGGTFQAGRQKDHLKSNFSWSKLKTCIGAAVSLGVSIASYSTGISAALATQTDVNDTIMNEKSASSENDDGRNPTSTSTAKKDGSGSKTETMASTPDQKANDATGAGRNQTIGEKQASNNEATANKNSNPGTATQKPSDEKNKSNGYNTAKANGSTKGVDYASRLAKAEKGVVDSIVNKSGIEGIVNDAFSFVDSIGTMIGSDETSRVTQSIMGTVVKCGNMGTFVAYGGTFKGYGSTPNTRNAVVEIVRSNNNNNPAVPNRYNGGQAYIYGGTFEGYTGANIFNMVRANTNQQRQMAKRDANSNRVYAVNVTLKESETNNMEQLYFENQEAVAQNNAEPVLINTRNVVVRGGTFRCHYEVMNMGIADSGGSGEGNFVKFPGTPGSVNLGVESYGADFIRDGRIQIVDNYGDGALVLMDEEKDDEGRHTGIYHYRLYCSDEELRYKTYLTVYPNTARTNSTYSMRLETYYGDEELQDISKAWQIDNDNTRDAAFANDEKYFAFPVDNRWETATYYVTPVLENTDPEGSKLDSSEVWYYSVPMSTKGDPIGSFTYGDVFIVYNKDGKTVRQTARGTIDYLMDEYVASLSKQGLSPTASFEKHDDYRVNMKWFRYRLYRVDPLTKASISESKTFGSDKPLAEVVYGTSESEAIRCILNLKDMEQQLLDKKVRLRDGTLWQGYQQGELYRVVFDVEEYLTYGFESAALSDGQLRTATAETSVMFACYGLSEKKPGENHMIEDYTPLQWISEPEVGKTASVGILNGFAGKVDYEQNANKIFDVYYQWYLCDEKGNVTENGANLIAGTDNVYKGHDGWTAAQNLAEKRYYTPDKWFDLDGNKIGNWTYKNTIDPNDPNIDSIDPETGMPKNYLEWNAEDLHAYTKELCGADMTMLALDKSKKVTRENNDVFATNTDTCYIPRSLGGKTVRVKCTVVNLKWLAAYDRVQTFWSHPVTIPANDVTLSYKSDKEYYGQLIDQVVAPGTEVTLLNPNLRSKEGGYILTGWKIDNKTYKQRDKYTVTKDTVATAIWEKAKPTITFDPVQGTGSAAPISVSYGESITLPSGGFVGINPGWTLKSWRIVNSYYEPGSKYTMLSTTDLVAYAQYRPSVVSFDANGGSGSMESYTLKADDQGNYTLPECRLTAPSWRTFDKWDLGNPGDVIQVRGDTTIKAQWRFGIMTFESGGGSGTMSPISATVADRGFKLPACTFTAPAGKEFAGYNIYIKQDNGDYKYVKKANVGDSVYTTSDCKAVATWRVKPPASFTLTWYANGGTGTLPAKVVIPNVSDQNTFTFPELPINPPEGSYFVGYQLSDTQSANAGTNYQPGQEVTINRDWYIVPVWSNVYYTVSFTANNPVTDEDGYRYYPAVDGGSMPASQQVERLIGKVTEPAEVPTAKGFTFNGWAFDFSQTGIWKDITIGANWSINSYAVNAVGGEHGTFTVKRTPERSGSVADFTLWRETDSAYPTNTVWIDATPEPGYMLDTVVMVNNETGETKQVFTGTIHTANDPERYKYNSNFTMPAADVTVYVTFALKQHTVTLAWPDGYDDYGRAYGSIWTSFGERYPYSTVGAAKGGNLHTGDKVKVRLWNSEEEFKLNRNETSELWLEICPAPYCEFASVWITVDGVRTDITNTMEFTMPDADVQVSVVFNPTEALFYNVYVGSDCYGSAKVAIGSGAPAEGGGLTAAEGDTVRLIAEPNPGYQFKEWAVFDYRQPGKRVIFVGNKQSNVADIIGLENNSFVYHAEYENANDLGESFRMPRVVLTAVFEPIAEVALSFNAGGGAGAMEAISVLPGEKCELPECEFLPLGCKEFVGWKIGSRTYQPGETVTVNAALTATAVWADTEHLVFQGETVTAPTCTAAGLAKLTCVRCGEDLGTTKIPARHDPGEAVFENEKPATATEPAGVDVVVYCAVCGLELSRTHKVKDETAEVELIDTETLHETDDVLIALPGAKASDVTDAAGTDSAVLDKDNAPVADDTALATCMQYKRPDGTVKPIVVKGDPDKDGAVTASDARLALRRAVDLETFPEGSPEYVACNVDGDAAVTASDARLILRVAVGLEELT